MEKRKKRPLTDEERKARAKASRRAYYLRNRDWLIEAQIKRERKKRRKAARERAKLPPPPPKEPKPRLTQEEIDRRKEIRRQEALRRRQEWEDLGWVVAKMNIKAGLSQDAIYRLLGGMASRQKISQWCSRGKKLRTLKKPR